jgi:hypothetical protein
VPEGQQVEIQVKFLEAITPSAPTTMSEGLAKVYAILGERYNSGTAVQQMRQPAIMSINHELDFC